MNWKDRYTKIYRAERKEKFQDWLDDVLWWFNIKEMWKNEEYDYSENNNTVQAILTLIIVLQLFSSTFLLWEKTAPAVLPLSVALSVTIVSILMLISVTNQ